MEAGRAAFLKLEPGEPCLVPLFEAVSPAGSKLGKAPTARVTAKPGVLPPGGETVVDGLPQIVIHVAHEASPARIALG